MQDVLGNADLADIVEPAPSLQRIKEVGAQSERLAKYNRLLAIEAETGLPVVGWPG